MFPKIEVNIEQIGTPNPSSLGRVFLFDPITKQHILRDGKLVEANEVEAVQQWLELLLKTQINLYRVYDDTAFGLNTIDLIGKKQFPLFVVQSMLEQEIKEKAKGHVLIQSISGFNIERLDKGLQITFSVTLKNSNRQEVSAIVSESNS